MSASNLSLFNFNITAWLALAALCLLLIGLFGGKHLVLRLAYVLFMIGSVLTLLVGTGFIDNLIPQEQTLLELPANANNNQKNFTIFFYAYAGVGLLSLTAFVLSWRKSVFHQLSVLVLMVLSLLLAFYSLQLLMM